MHVTSAIFFFWDLWRLFLLHHWRCAKNCYRSLRTGGQSSSLFFCCGESPRRCRVCDSVCARHGKRLPLRRQFELHVRCPLILSSEMLKCGLSWGSAVQTLGHIRDDMSGSSVGHIPLRNSHAIAKLSWLLNGAHSCAAPSYFFHMRTVCLFNVIYIGSEVS